MSQENVELVRNFYTSKLAEMKLLVDPECLVSEAGGLPYSGDWVGADGWEQLILTIARDYKFRMLKQDVYDLGGELVLRLADVEFTNRSSGETAIMHLNEIHRVRHGRVVGVDVYYKDPGALPLSPGQV